MGQKVSPIGFRTSVTKKWRSLWFANKKEFGDQVVEDFRIREFLKKSPSCQGASRFTIKRTSGRVEITIHTSRPGLVIGKRGAEIDVLKEKLGKITGKEVWIEVEEIKRPDLDAVLLADSVARQLERRIAFRRVMKKTMQSALDAGAQGVKIMISGRIGGSEIARTEWYREGRVPLHTLKTNIDYGTSRAETTYGTIGVKVWVNLGEESTTERTKGG